MREERRTKKVVILLSFGVFGISRELVRGSLGEDELFLHFSFHGHLLHFLFFLLPPSVVMVTMTAARVACMSSFRHGSRGLMFPSLLVFVLDFFFCKGVGETYMLPLRLNAVVWCCHPQPSSRHMRRASEVGERRRKAMQPIRW